MSPTLLVYFALLALKCDASDAISKYVRRRKIHNSSTTILNDDSSSRVIWIEHTYQLLNGPITERIIGDVLKIAISTHEDFAFDFHEGVGYTAELFRAIQLANRLEFVDLNATTGAAGDLMRGDVDLAISDARFADGLPRGFQFIPTLQTRFALVYKPSKVKFTKDIFVITFAGSLWLAFVAILIASACCLRITTNYYYAIYPAHEKWTWVEITLWAIATACQQGLSYAPHKFASCLVFLIGYVTAYLLYTGFTAGITSTLLQDHVTELNVKNVKLDDFNLKVVGLEYVTDLDERDLKITSKAKNMHGLFSYLNNKNTVGVAPTILIEQYLATTFENGEAAESYATTILPWNYRRGVIIKSDSRWRQDLMKRLIKLQELGISQNILKRNSFPPAHLNSSIYSSAGIEHVGSAIMLFLGGALLAIVFLTFEFMVAYYTHHNVNK